jgi:hypothetical protein
VASQEEIDELRGIIGDVGLTDEQLGEIIDRADSMNEAVQFTWESVAARSHTLVNVSEAGSSRSLGTIFDNSLKLAEYYRNQAASEEAALTARRTTIRRITRPQA